MAKFGNGHGNVSKMKDLLYQAFYVIVVSVKMGLVEFSVPGATLLLN